jgi:hypothetical protein
MSTLGPETAEVVKSWPTCAHGHAMQYIGRTSPKNRQRWDCPECTKAKKPKTQKQVLPGKRQELPLCGMCGAERSDLEMVMHPWKATAMFACPSCAAAVSRVRG